MKCRFSEGRIERKVGRETEGESTSDLFSSCFSCFQPRSSDWLWAENHTESTLFELFLKFSRGPRNGWKLIGLIIPFVGSLLPYFFRGFSWNDQRYPQHYHREVENSSESFFLSFCLQRPKHLKTKKNHERPSSGVALHSQSWLSSFNSGWWCLTAGWQTNCCPCNPLQLSEATFGDKHGVSGHRVVCASLSCGSDWWCVWACVCVCSMFRH